MGLAGFGRSPGAGVAIMIRATKTHVLQMALKDIEFFVGVDGLVGEVTFLAADAEIGDFVQLVYSSGPVNYVISDIEFYRDDLYKARILEIEQENSNGPTP